MMMNERIFVAGWGEINYDILWWTENPKHTLCTVCFLLLTGRSDVETNKGAVKVRHHDAKPQKFKHDCLRTHTPYLADDGITAEKKVLLAIRTRTCPVSKHWIHETWATEADIYFIWPPVSPFLRQNNCFNFKKMLVVTGLHLRPLDVASFES